MNKKVSIPEIGIAEIVDYEPTQEIEKQIALFEEEAEKDIASKKQTANVHFRWSEFEIKRAKKIADLCNQHGITKEQLERALKNR